jgi:CelD/BcsL family acetyltransferase involved in cellulose biosynthesis
VYDAIPSRETRALLEGVTDADAYYREAVRPKKRKELRRLRHRLDELGQVQVSALGPGDALEPWCDAFLRLEAAGWKGEEGTALGCDPATEAFFRKTVAAARAAGKLQFLRLDVDGRAIAMLANFLAPPGGLSFKTAFDPDFARFSPGVLIQLENLRLVERAGLAWMDSCAAEHHPMIDSLWSGRRRIVRVTVRLKGFRRGLVFAGCRALESGSAALRRLARGRDG